VDCGRKNVPAAGALVCLECELDLLKKVCAQLAGELEHFEEVATMEKRAEMLSQIRRRPASAEPPTKT
jgi:hypothetical protein